MSLNLNELLKKAKTKGASFPGNKEMPFSFVKPWQQESTLFNIPNTPDKLGTNWEQTGVRSGNKLGTNWEQTGNKLGTKNTQTGNKLGSEVGTEVGTKWEQSGNKVGTKVSFSSLAGLQRTVVFFIYNECKLSRSETTENLTLEHISTALKSSKGTVKTTLKRLEKKGYIKRITFKNGRGGWSKYAIPNFMFQELLQYESGNKVGTKWEQSGNKVGSELGTELGTTPYVCSSNNINTTTYVPENFKQIDYSPLSSFGFDESHIIQIYREYAKHPELSLSAEIIQNSIYALAYDLKHNDVVGSFKNTPVVVLTALLKKGQPYSSKTPHKVLSPREEAMQEYTAAQEKRHRQIWELENKTKEFKLQEWLKSLPEQELETFTPQDPRPEGMPERIYQTSRRKKALAAAQEYFITVLWPQKLIEFEGSQQIREPEI